VYHADTLTNEVFAGWRINSDDENAPRITEIPESGLPESHIE